MVKLSTLFLNCFLISSCSSQVTLKKDTIDCDNKQIQDSLIQRYITNGANNLFWLYNDPKWEVYCDSVINLCPNIAYAYRQKAIPYIKNGEYEKAFRINDKAVELDSKSWTAYRGFVKCIFLKDYEGAIVDFKKAQELTPNGYEMDHSYFFYIALCNLELHNYPESELNFQKDVFIQTSNIGAKNIHFNTFMYFGILYYEMNATFKAKEYLQKCVAIYRESPSANYYLALTYELDHDYKLRDKYLKVAQESFALGYNGVNEDNDVYINYPHQITLYEVEQAISKKINEK